MLGYVTTVEGRPVFDRYCGEFPALVDTSAAYPIGGNLVAMPFVAKVRGIQKLFRGVALDISCVTI